MTKARRMYHGGLAPGRRGGGRWVGWASLILLTNAAIADDPTANRHEFRQTHMGSEFKIVLYTTDSAEARRASDAAFVRIADLDRALSDYNPESELMKLCDRAGGPPVEVSEDLFRCLERADEVSKLSDGAFDVTIGPVGRLWRRTRRTRELPDPETLARARELVGYRNVRLDPAKRTVQLLKPQMKLDLGAIAKGDACDQAIAVLKKCGIASALVAGAGDIVVSGPPPGQAGWRIGVAEPDGDPDRPSRFLSLSHVAVSTSGDAERFVEIDGKRYSHMVDPRTGVGVIDRASVTVVAPDGITADVLDTTIYLLGPDRGMPLIEDTPGAAAIYVRAGERPRTEASRRWKGLSNDTSGSGTGTGEPR